MIAQDRRDFAEEVGNILDGAISSLVIAKAALVRLVKEDQAGEEGQADDGLREIVATANAAGSRLLPDRGGGPDPADLPSVEPKVGGQAFPLDQLKGQGLDQARRVFTRAFPETEITFAHVLGFGRRDLHTIRGVGPRAVQAFDVIFREAALLSAWLES